MRKRRFAQQNNFSTKKPSLTRFLCLSIRSSSIPPHYIWSYWESLTRGTRLSFCFCFLYGLGPERKARDGDHERSFCEAKTESSGGPGGTRTHKGLRPRDFHTATIFIALCSSHKFVVWTISSPHPLALDPRREPFSLYTFPNRA